MYEVIHADVREGLASLPDNSIHCAITSPPYWGLRDYGTADWRGGDPECNHVEMSVGMSERNTLGSGGLPPTNAANVGRVRQFREVCGKCGAERQDRQIGLESTPEVYVAELVGVFREVRRVLRPDGTFWLNIGDSYAAARGGSYQPAESMAGGVSGVAPDGQRVNRSRRDGHSPSRDAPSFGLKHKDLVGIPWRLAFALQGFAVVGSTTLTQWADWLREAREAGDWHAVEIVEGRIRAQALLDVLKEEGWWLRQDIVWSKPAPMPESVRDRCTKAHEYVFLLTKSSRYYYDAEAIREPVKATSGKMSASKRGSHVFEKGATVQNAKTDEVVVGANRRSVWEVATSPYAEAHFATFPPQLVLAMIRAGTSHKGCCPQCGAPWKRVLEKKAYTPPAASEGERNVDASRGDKNRKIDGRSYNEQSKRRTLGWKPTCTCPKHKPVPCTVLDPFAGSGTTLAVAVKHGRRGVGVELNPKYVKMIHRRVKLALNAAGLFRK